MGLGHGPVSEVTLISLFFGVKTPGSFWGNCFPSLDGFFHGQNFSAHFSVSSTKVWFLVFVLTLRIRRTASLGKSHEKNPFSNSQWELSDLAIFICNNINGLCYCILSKGFYALLSIAMLGFLGSRTKLNHVFPCLSII